MAVEAAETAVCTSLAAGSYKRRSHTAGLPSARCATRSGLEWWLRAAQPSGRPRSRKVLALIFVAVLLVFAVSMEGSTRAASPSVTLPARR